MEAVTDIIFLGSKITVDSDCNHEKMFAPRKENYDKPKQYVNKQRHHFADKSPYNQSHGFSNIHVRLWELDHKEDWELKNYVFEFDAGEDSWESDIKLVNPKS